MSDVLPISILFALIIGTIVVLGKLVAIEKSIDDRHKNGHGFKKCDICHCSYVPNVTLCNCYGGGKDRSKIV